MEAVSLNGSMADVVSETGVLVVGGGFLGSHIAAGFAAAGVTTSVLTRSPSVELAERLDGVELHAGDASDAGTFRYALGDLKNVIWCAGGLLPAEANADPVAHVAMVHPPFPRALEVLRFVTGASVTYLSSGGSVYGG